MKLYVNGYSCSLFGDEEIILNKSWNDSQMITSYGSYSKTFSIPCDSNNNKIFQNYNVIGGSTLNPNYFLDAYILINGIQFNGNVQLQSFSWKDGMLYSYNLIFYMDEKSLIKDLGDIKMNDLNWNFFSILYTMPIITTTWVNSFENVDVFVPLMACTRPFAYDTTPGLLIPNNIRWDDGLGSTGNTSGVILSDLYPSYKMQLVLETLFSQNNLNLIFEENVLDFLYEMYIMPNTDVKFSNGDITAINLYCSDDIVTFYSSNDILHQRPHTENKLKYLSDQSTNTSNDFDSVNNKWVCPSSGVYQIEIGLNYNENPAPVCSSFFVDLTIGGIRVLPKNYSQVWQKTTYELNLTAGQEIEFRTGKYYFNAGGGSGQHTIPPHIYYKKFETTESPFIESYINISKKPQLIWGFYKTGIKWSDIKVIDFFLEFCNSFNLFFQYENDNILLSTKNELIFNSGTTYDLTNYLLTDGNYTFKNEPKYKNINYKFKEGKDINNIAYKTTSDNNYNEFAQYIQYFNYDVGNNELKFESKFTVFPDTLLNETTGNIILGPTQIPLHSELDSSLNPIKTDFLLFYKRGDISGLTDTYALQIDDTPTWWEATFVSNYSNTNSLGYSLNYNNIFYDLNFGFDNNTIKYETTMNFLLPLSILYKLKVYDRIIVHNIYYEIKSFNFNLKTGYTEINLKTI